MSVFIFGVLFGIGLSLTPNVVEVVREKRKDRKKNKSKRNNK